MTIAFKIAMFFFLSAFALEVGDDIELTNFLNARSFSNFYRNTGNVKFQLPKGTIGRIVEKKLFNSGNYGLKISIANGTHEGEVAWVYYNVKSPRLELRASVSSEENPPKENVPSTQDNNVESPLGSDARDTAGMQVVPMDVATHVETTMPIQASQTDLETMAPTKIDVSEAIGCFEALDQALDMQNQYRKDYLAIGRTRGRVTGALLFHADRKNGDRVIWYPGVTPAPDHEVMDFYEFRAPPGSNLDPESLRSVIPYPPPEKMVKADGRVTFEIVEFLLARSFKLGIYATEMEPINQTKYSVSELKQRKIHAFETCAKTESNAWVKRYAQYWVDMLTKNEKGKMANVVLPGLRTAEESNGKPSANSTNLGSPEQRKPSSPTDESIRTHSTEEEDHTTGASDGAAGETAK